MAIRRGSFFLLRLLIASGILYYLLKKIPLSEVMASISSAKVNYVVAACTVPILIQLILTVRLKLLTDRQGMGLSACQLFDINFTSVFYGLFLPGGNIAGGIVRFYKLSKPDNKRAQAIASVVLDRIAATITLCMVGILFWLIDFPSDSGNTGLNLTVALGMVLILYALLFSKRASLYLRKGFDMINLSTVRNGVDNLFKSFDKYQNLSSVFLAFVFTLSVIAQLLGILSYYLVAMSLGIDISFVTIGWIRSVVTIITMIPISISGIGVREGMLLLLLQPYGISGEESLALSFLVFGVSFLLIGAIGGLIEARNLFFPSGGKEKPYKV